jgi:hypothetical protein
MNDLSWLLYWAGVSEVLQTVIMILAGLGVVGFGIVLIICITGGFMEDSALRTAIFSALTFLCVLLLVGGAFIPSRHTILMIAASEAGEQVLKNPGAQEALGEAGEIGLDSLKLLKQFIEEQIKDKPPDGG